MRNSRLNALTAEAIRKAARKLRPAPVQRWGVRIEGDEFPALQLVREAANLLDMSAPPVRPGEFISHDAVRILKRLGFEKDLKYHG